MHTELECKQKNNENNVDIYIVHYIWFINSKKLCFILILKEKNDKVLKIDIIQIPNFETSASI